MITFFIQLTSARVGAAKNSLSESAERNRILGVRCWEGSADGIFFDFWVIQHMVSFSISEFDYFRSNKKTLSEVEPGIKNSMAVEKIRDNEITILSIIY